MAEGDIARARSLYEESLAVGVMPEWSLRMLSFVALHEGDVAAARRYVRDSLDGYRNLAMPWGQVECLNACAGIALAQERWETAGRLLGAVAGLHRMLVGGGMYGEDRRENERFLATARAALGAERFAAAWAEGESMRLNEAIALALAE